MVRGEERRPVLKPVPRDGRLPLSYAQLGFWLMEQTRRGRGFGDTAALRLTGDLDGARLEWALNEIAWRHEALRTTFSSPSDGPSLVIRPDAGVSLPVEPLGDVSEEALRTRCAVEAERPMDLRRGPLFRAMLLQAGPREHILVVTLHHALTDAWSWWRVFFPELQECYGAACARRRPSLPPLSIQYADYASWQRRWVECREAAVHLDYWIRRLDASTAPPDLCAGQPGSDGRPAALPLALPESVGTAVRELGRQERGTPFMVIAAALIVLLHLRSGLEDVVIGTRANVRTRVEMEGVIGPFVNVLALRARVSRSMTFRDLLRQVRARALEAYAHRELPFALVVERLRPSWAPGRPLLFNVMVSFDHVVRTPPTLPGVTVAELPYRRHALYPLDLVLSEDGRQLDGTLVSDPRVVDGETAMRIREQLRTILSESLRAPDARLASL